MWKDFLSKRIALKIDVTGPLINTVWRRVRAYFSPEILQAGAVKGLTNIWVCTFTLTFTHHLYWSPLLSPLLITFTHHLYSHLYSSPLFADTCIVCLITPTISTTRCGATTSAWCVAFFFLSAFVILHQKRPQPVLWRVWRRFRQRQRGTLSFCAITQLLKSILGTIQRTLSFCLMSSDAKEHIRDNPTHSIFLFNVLRC